MLNRIIKVEEIDSIFNKNNKYELGTAENL